MVMDNAEAQLLAQDLEAAATDAGPLDDAARRRLEDVLERYPWFTAARIALAVGRPEAENADELRAAVALEAASPATLAFVGRGAAWASFYPEPKAVAPQDTEGAIDRFLEKYGHSSPEEDALLERMIFNPAPDYAEMLARQEQDDMPVEPFDPDSEQGRIDRFILGHHPGSPERREPVKEERPEPGQKSRIAKPHPADNSLLSESLANVFIKQGRFKQAYDIICSLNLNYPKKSAYFADQLRFLQKVIANERYKTGTGRASNTEK